MWYQSLKKSSLTPPPLLFQIVWPILYIMMIVSMIFVYRKYDGNFWISLPFIFFMIQLLLNLSWSPLFFTFHQICVSLIILFLIILFVVLTIKEFSKYSNTAAYLLIPYLLWLVFAFYLNLFICVSNNY
jgi:translocator protein